MKKIIFSSISFLLFSIAISSVANAQTTSEYCAKFFQSNDPIPTECQNDPSYVPPSSGQVAGGTLPSNPFNSNAPVTSGTSAIPQSSSIALKSCSAIRFVSLLDIVIWIKCIIVAALIPLIFSAAFLYFLWGVFKFMQSSENKDKEDAKKRVLWGLIGLFAMVSVWGIIKILGDTLGIQSAEFAVPLLQTEYLNPNNASQKTGG